MQMSLVVHAYFAHGLDGQMEAGRAVRRLLLGGLVGQLYLAAGHQPDRGPALVAHTGLG